MEISLENIFEERPQKWGLRGDPYLWDDLRRYFEYIHTPLTEEAFKLEFYKAFLELTGSTLDEEYIFVPKYAHGGLSSGMVSGKFWSETALPMLIQRLNQYQQIFSEYLLFKNGYDGSFIPGLKPKFDIDWVIIDGSQRKHKKSLSECFVLGI